MTLLIACMLIYQFHWSADWYVIATAIWIARHAIPWWLDTL